MSNTQIQPEMESGELRAQKLAAARKKLKTFRASRSSGQTSSPAITHSPSPSSSSATRSRSPAALPPLPLTESDATNARPSRTPARTKSKEILADTAVEERRKLRKPRSKGSLSSHRRQQSSISGNHAPARASVMSVFDSRPGPSYAGSDTLGVDPTTITPNEIITTPATPLTDSTDVMRGLDGSQTPAGSEDDEITRNRLSAFSFGAKATSRSPSPSSRRPLRSSFPFEPPWNGSPLQSPSRNLSTPLSRPPSLYLTKATPLAFGSPSASGPPRGSLSASSGSPSSPPTPARKRHSHTRSDSISLPNLKLATRPNSLGFPSSPSFPASPCSPLSGNEGSARPNVSSNGQRLKFEPSGRGAEAEKEKDEYRRKALEKLTGGGRAPPVTQEPQAEISLPDLDDEDVSSNSSSTRPLSDAFSTLSFGRPTSLAMSNLTSSSSSTPNGLFASPFSWSSPEQDEGPVSDRWSNGSGNFSFPFAKDDGLGFGIDLSVPKRASVTTGLSVLAEEDENDDDDTATSPEEDDTATQPTLEPVPAAPSPSTHLPIVLPTPTRLRELTLLAHATVTPAKGSTDSPLRQTSPTKGYGTIGRGRPRPLSGIMPGHSNHPTSANSTPVSAMMSTPKSASSASARRRAAPGSGSRGSSISYKKDTDSYSQSGSSRDWSGIGSPPLTSPPMSFSSPRFSGMGSVPRSNKRPCPRPASLVGLGIDGRGAGRILGEVDETDEEMSNGVAGRASQDSNGSWREGHLELQLERDALKEDVAVWKERCGDLETKLEAERKETVALRERVRKLSDRLSAVSAAPNANDQSVLVENLRKELFGLTSQFERERSEKTRLLGRVTELEARPTWKPKFESSPPVLEPVPFSKPLLPSVLANQYQQIVAPSLYSGIPEAIVTPATPIPCDTPENVSSPDPNLYRMKAWGFPRGPVQPNRSTQRDSFFGLSSLLHRSEQNDFEDEEEAGMDLPPISFPDVRDSHAQRAASFPEMSSSRAAESNTVRSASASASIGFLTSYLPKRLPTSDAIAPFESPRVSRSLVEHVSPEEEVVICGKLDFSFGCQCCVGEVIEV
ncbi:hypothetical protein BCR39DRAFT_559540 [Naematelia encephala]|uniref:Uncharacterized protein n=1 Tax=Naematelia encephala TaxID=71784 RepID=A0A1Y2B140_9TREE|nr:hypothetical protein BCR39DRAFT_559540 [Naematelia encephala]